MRFAGNRLTGQLDDPNLYCTGESLLPTAEHADFVTDPVERTRQEMIASNRFSFPGNRAGSGVR